FVGSYGVLVVDQTGATLVTDGRYAEIAEGMVSDAKVLVQPLIKVDDWFRDFFRARGYERVGFEGSLAWDEVERLKKRTRPAKSRLVESAALVHQLRRVKDESEIRAIARAARIADAMMEAAQTAARPGTPELELSQLIRRTAEDL